MEIVRKQQAITFEVEKKLLDYLAGKLYKFFTADQLSALGVLGAVISTGCYIYARDSLWLLHIASFGIFLHWFGDSLDGRTARLRNENRPKYGHYLDHLLDGISGSIMMLAIAYSGMGHAIIWVWLLNLYLLLMVHTLLKANVTGTFELAFARLGPTETRIAMIFANFLIYFSQNQIIIDSPVQLTVLDGCGLIGLSTLIVVYTKSVATALWGKNRIREAEISKEK